MKMHGKTVSGVYIETVVIPRPPTVTTKEDGTRQEIENYYAFKLGAVLDYGDFDKMCPRPEAPIVIRPGGVQGRNVEDKDYKEMLTKWGLQRFYWGFLKSIAFTDKLEFESVDMTKPETWENYEKELQKSGFSAVEIGRLYKGFHAANGMDEEKMEAARKSFLLSPQGQSAQ